METEKKTSHMPQIGEAVFSLEATDMGCPLYEKYGFVKMNHEMELPEVSRLYGGKYV